MGRTTSKKLLARQKLRRFWCSLPGHRWGAPVVVLLLVALALDAVLLPSGSEFKDAHPDSTSIMNERSEEAISLGKPFRIRSSWIPLRQIDRDLIEAVLVSEDASFFDHSGFDLHELSQSVWGAIKKLSFPRGASTISQQLAKNLYLSTSKSPIRKWREAIITIKIENTLSKARILELYLNLIEWGDGIFGIEAASQHYFGRSARSLSKEQAAFLTALIPNPRTYYNPKINPRRVASKQRLILKKMELFTMPNFTA